MQICVDSDYKDILSLTSVTSPGTAVNPVTVTEKAASGKTRTVTYNSAYFQSCEPIKIENEAEHQYFVDKPALFGGSQHLVTGHSLKLCTVIDYLNQQGRVDEAEKLLNRVLFHFGEVYPKETLLQTPIHDLIGIICLNDLSIGYTA